MLTVQRGGSSVALLEITGSKGAVQVNGKTYRRNARLILSGGDEVVFGSSGKHSYVSFTHGFLGRIYLYPLLVPACSSFLSLQVSLICFVRKLFSHEFSVFRL